MKPICVKCQVEYAVKNGGIGHLAIEMAHKPPSPYRATFGDLLICPGCDHVIMANYAEVSTPHFASDFSMMVEGAIKNNIAVFCFEKKPIP